MQIWIKIPKSEKPEILQLQKDKKDEKLVKQSGRRYPILQKQEQDHVMLFMVSSTRMKLKLRLVK